MGTTGTEPYDVLASVYDHWQYSFDQPYNRLVKKMLKRELRRYRYRPGGYLDCACGTGDVALFMTDLGWSTVGVDSSEGMLRKAEEKSRGHTGNCTFLHQRLEKLALDGTFRVAGSFYDSLNHITSKRQLQAALKEIRRHLETEGLFIFDTNTLACYRHLWNSLTVGHEEEYTLIIENNFDEAKRMALSNVTVFLKKNNSSYRKMTAQIEERWYTDEELGQMLKRAGFTILRSEPLHLFRYDGTEAYKRWWVCRAT
jgi:ubiquinone/menaquinone biosynthesis C-methylase UbiE